MSSQVVEQDEYTPVSDAQRDPLSIPADVKASISILVVDDDRTLREGCASVLQMDGYNVTFSGRGDEAVDLVKRRKRRRNRASGTALLMELAHEMGKLKTSLGVDFVLFDAEEVDSALKSRGQDHIKVLDEQPINVYRPACENV
jgi:CheY-like chemotaxis protein